VISIASDSSTSVQRPPHYLALQGHTVQKLHDDEPPALMIGNLISPPPEHAQHEVDGSQSQQHVTAKKEPIEDTKDWANGDYAEKSDRG